MNTKEDDLVLLSRQLLNDSLEALDDSVLSRLRHSRQQALKIAIQAAEKPKVSPFEFPGWLAPVSTGATFATIALVFTLFWTQPFPHLPHLPQSLPQSLQQQGSSFMEDIELLSQSEELEFYQNLDFYLWLEDETNS